MAVSGEREEIRKAVIAVLREGHAMVDLVLLCYKKGVPQ